MIISRVCPFTGALNTMEIDVTDEQIMSWRNGMMIQQAMPNLSADEREFIMTGITPYMWDEMASDDEHE